MARCKYCEKSGAFLSVDKSGLCKKCVPIVKNLLFNTKHDYETNLIYLDDPADQLDLFRTIKDIRENLAIFIDLKNKGILTNDSNPEQLLQNLEKEHDSFYMKLFQWDYDQLVTKIANMKMKKYQLSNIEKFLMHLEKQKEYFKNQELLDPLIEKTMKLRSLYQS